MRVLTQGIPGKCFGFCSTPHMDKNDAIKVSSNTLKQLKKKLEDATAEFRQKKDARNYRRDPDALQRVFSLQWGIRNVEHNAGNLTVPMTYLWKEVKHHGDVPDYKESVTRTWHAYFVMEGVGWAYRYHHAVCHTFFASMFKHHSSVPVLVEFNGKRSLVRYIPGRCDPRIVAAGIGGAPNTFQHVGCPVPVHRNSRRTKRRRTISTSAV